MAVPKKKTSYSRKKMRSSNNKYKYLNFTKCSNCNHLKRMHFICKNCYNMK